MDLLIQEKMAHVEELRQIHADINAVSTQLLKLFFFSQPLFFGFSAPESLLDPNGTLRKFSSIITWT